MRKRKTAKEALCLDRKKADVKRYKYQQMLDSPPPQTWSATHKPNYHLSRWYEDTTTPVVEYKREFE